MRTRHALVVLAHYDPVVTSVRRVGLLLGVVLTPILNLNIYPDDNWFHFLWQKLPGLLLADKYDKIAIGLANRTQLEALRQASKMLGCWEKLSFFRSGDEIPDQSEQERAEFLRRLADSVCQSTGNRKVFLSRKGFSRYGGSIESLAVALGCEAVRLHEMSFREQVTTIRESSLIVGQIGSALVNIMFCNPGTRIVELCLDPDQTKVYQGLVALAGCSWQRIQL
jgi:glycosyl transferase family 61